MAQSLKSDLETIRQADDGFSIGSLGTSLLKSFDGTLREKTKRAEEAIAAYETAIETYKARPSPDSAQPLQQRNKEAQKALMELASINTQATQTAVEDGTQMVRSTAVSVTAGIGGAPAGAGMAAFLNGYQAHLEARQNGEITDAKVIAARVISDAAPLAGLKLASALKPVISQAPKLLQKAAIPVASGAADALGEFGRSTFMSLHEGKTLSQSLQKATLDATIAAGMSGGLEQLNHIGAFENLAKLGLKVGGKALEGSLNLAKIGSTQAEKIINEIGDNVAWLMNKPDLRLAEAGTGMDLGPMLMAGKKGGGKKVQKSSGGGFGKVTQEKLGDGFTVKLDYKPKKIETIGEIAEALLHKFKIKNGDILKGDDFISNVADIYNDTKQKIENALGPLTITEQGLLFNFMSAIVCIAESGIKDSPKYYNRANSNPTFGNCGFMNEDADIMLKFLKCIETKNQVNAFNIESAIKDIIEDSYSQFTGLKLRINAGANSDLKYSDYIEGIKRSLLAKPEDYRTSVYEIARYSKTFDVIRNVNDRNDIMHYYFLPFLLDKKTSLDDVLKQTPVSEILSRSSQDTPEDLIQDLIDEPSDISEELSTLPQAPVENPPSVDIEPPVLDPVSPAGKSRSPEILLESGATTRLEDLFFTQEGALKPDSVIGSFANDDGGLRKYILQGVQKGQNNQIVKSLNKVLERLSKPDALQIFRSSPGSYHLEELCSIADRKICSIRVNQAYRLVFSQDADGKLRNLMLTNHEYDIALRQFGV